MILKESILNISGITKFNGKILVFSEHRLDFSSQEVKLILTSTFYDSFASEKNAIFQEKYNDNLKLISSNFVISEIKGRYSIRSAIHYEKQIAVANIDTKTYHIVNSENSTNLGFYFKKTGQLSEDLIFNHGGSSVLFYDLINHKIAVKIDLLADFGLNCSIRRILNSQSNCFQIITQNGVVLSFGLHDFKVKWKGIGIDRLAHYNDDLYTISNFKIQKVNARTGAVMLETSLDVARQYGWMPTNELLVGQNFIFCLSTEKDGQIAVVNRKNLKFIDVVKTGIPIPFGTKSAISLNNNLYVLDTESTLHIFTIEV